ncbi:hypothetical protein [Dictyobacter formicarum]|uniref:Response regulatory domain-containing protein n=1 Tax=Dictyobacter formicarum TaxID=2778368 RepID=A0ABQ3VVN9_9CHLR|nr:hypothetical protein [Dictyobacter formicarum]GHO89826.1 hypothetical protein KSZ_78320 [Dictyobacter formicarum]
MRLLRGDPRTRNVPLFDLTCMTREEDRLTLLLRAADEYLTKPFKKTLLIARIEHVLRLTPAERHIRTDSLAQSRKNVD